MTDWQVGDLALCVDDRICPYWGTNAGIAKGTVYLVTGVTGPEVSYLHGPTNGLVLEGVACPAGLNAASARFRKIKPDPHEACEPEFVTLLKRRKVSA